MPEETIRFNRKKHIIQEYMTSELINGILHRDKLYHKYEKCKENDPNKKQLKEEHDVFAENFKKLIRARRREFYHEKFNNTGSDFKKTWKNINFILNIK